MQSSSWHISLLGPLCASREATILTHFRTHKTGELLAYLATFPGKASRREELIELLWPDVELDSGRNSLRIALTFLRGLLNAPTLDGGNEFQPALITDRQHVSLNIHACSTDKSDFEEMLRKAARITEPSEQAQGLHNALCLYTSELLPDYDSQWAVGERRRLVETYLLATRRLIALLFDLREVSAAFDYAHRAIQADPLREESHLALLQLYLETGQYAEVRRHFEVMEQEVYAALGYRPSAQTRNLMARLEAQGRDSNQNVTTDQTPVNMMGLPFPSSAPAPRSSSLRIGQRGEIPSPADPFFGREEELATVRDMIHTPHTRLVTLTGLGGSGKTRLALALARRLQEDFDGAVWFVPLENVQEPRHILEAAAQSLCLPRANPLPPEKQIAHALGDSPSLLILDNYEHLLPEGAKVLRTLLDAAPELLCLVTSRQRLNIRGEYEYAVHPLPTPSAPGTPERLLEFASVQLFADRARQGCPDFEVTPDNCADIAALCHHLEGVPLALELAAAYAQTLSPGQIRGYLKPRFALLVNRSHDAPARHASLRAALDWSAHRLPPALFAFFTRCSVLRGTWGLRAAQSVCGPLSSEEVEFPLPPEFQTLEAVTQLRERSLLQVETISGEKRYRMLETVREYAGENLSREERQNAQLRLSAYALDLAEEAENQLCGGQAGKWLDCLEQEHDNLRAALHFLLEENGSASSPVLHHALYLAAALNYFWHVRGNYTEGQEWLTRALARDSNADASLLQRAQLGLGNLALAQQNLPVARAAYETVLALAEARGDSQALASAWGSQANVAEAQGDLAAAQSLYERSLLLFRTLDMSRGIALTLSNLSGVLSAQGKSAQAETLLREALNLFREAKDTPSINLCLNNLADCFLQQSQMEQACAALQESLQMAQDIQNPYGLAQALRNVATLAANRKRERAAAELLGYVDSQFAQIQTPLNVLERARVCQDRQRLADVLGKETFEQAFERGRFLPAAHIRAMAETELALAAR